MKKKLLAVAMAALMVASLAGCGGGAKETTAAETGAETTVAGAETTAAKTEETKAATGGTLIMGTNAEFPPYEFYDGDKVVGIDAEIAQAIAEKLGMELKIEDMSFDAIIPSVSSGKIDFGAAGMTVTDERKESVDFTDTYATSTQVTMVAEGSDITDQAGLKGKLIGVQLGTTGDILAGDIEGATIERYNKGFEAVQSLTQGKIDAVVIDEATAKAFLANTKGMKILEEKMSDEEYAIAVKKGNTELVEKINGALEELKTEGKLDEIIAKYIKAE
ncbi:MAG: basic amino acid ABC transporter substrate-binding protein [Clostridium sp.]